MILENEKQNNNQEGTEFKLELGISTTNFSSKPLKSEIPKLKFSKEEISINDFIGKIKLGYVFTHKFQTKGNVFGISQKTDANFTSANLIWIDVDDAPFGLESAIDKLSFKPTIAYTTFRNQTEGCGFRYRFLYLFDFSITDIARYSYYYHTLVKMIINDLGTDFKKYIDNCSASGSQMFFGTNINCGFYNYDLIFNRKQISELCKRYKVCELDECTISNNVTVKKKRLLNSHNKESSTSKLCEELRVSYNPYINNLLVSNIDLVEPSEGFIYKDVGDENIYQVQLHYGKDNKIKKVPKGQRNEYMFNHAKTIRNIKNDISELELAKRLWWLYNNYYEKSKDFTMYQTCKIAQDVLLLDSNDENFKKVGKRNYIINKKYKHLPQAEKAKEIGKAKRIRRDNKILPNYDFNKPVTENSIILGVSEGSIYNAFKDNGISCGREIKYEMFLETYINNPDKRSVRKLMKLTGYSNSTIQKYLVKLKEESPNIFVYTNEQLTLNNQDSNNKKLTA